MCVFYIVNIREINMNKTYLFLLICGAAVGFLHSFPNDEITLNDRDAKTFFKRSSRQRRSIESLITQECCVENVCNHEEMEETNERYSTKTVCQYAYDHWNYCKTSPHRPVAFILPSTIKSGCYPYICACDGRETQGGWDFVNIRYDFANTKTDSSSHIQLSPITNNGLHLNVKKVDTELKRTVTVTEEEWFEVSEGTTLSSSASFEVGIPEIGIGASVSTSLTESKMFTIGLKRTKTERRETKSTCPWIPGKFVVCEIYFMRSTVSVPFEMRIKNKAFGCECTNTGVFRKVHSSSLHQQISLYSYIPSKYHLGR